jgi:hypothetical protein
VLIVTGIWNIAAVKPTWGTSYTTTLMVKIGVVAVSGITAFLHSNARSRKGLAVFGALTGVSALLAMFLGIMLG